MPAPSAAPASSGPRGAPRTDRFGFFTGPGARERDALHGLQGPSPPPTRWAARLEALRAEKWRRSLTIARSWPSGRTLILRVRKGVPDAVRGLVWQRLAGTAALAARQPGLYAAALARDPSPADLLMIAVDLPRTYPQHALFATADAAAAAPAHSGGTAALLADGNLSPGQVRGPRLPARHRTTTAVRRVKSSYLCRPPHRASPFPSPTATRSARCATCSGRTRSLTPRSAVRRGRGAARRGSHSRAAALLLIVRAARL